MNRIRQYLRTRRATARLYRQLRAMHLQRHLRAIALLYR
jgi:hypothetical protein